MFLVRVCERLTEFGVPYALVGGHAVALHGAPRGTLDIDIVIETSLSAFESAEQALRSMGLSSYLPLTAKYVFEHRDELQQERNLVAWSFINHANPAEIVDIIIAEELQALKVEEKVVAGVAIRVVSLESLTEMKRQTGRAQDTSDADALERLKESK